MVLKHDGSNLLWLEPSIMTIVRAKPLTSSNTRVSDFFFYRLGVTVSEDVAVRRGSLAEVGA